MIHLGDITKINGYEVPIVDCVIGGSPCQDLSIAGKRAGLAGERSGLYIEQIRLIKEMREQYVRNHRGSNVVVRPRYMVWENVPGAFSSNNGKDFAAVLEEAIRIAEPDAPDVPVPPKGWSSAGAIVGDGWSVAWRTHDAQYWGVSQRRKRISLVADFGGKSAPEILFECKSVSRDSEQSGKERKRPSEGTQGSTSYAVRIRGGCDGGGKGALVQEEKSGTLGTGNDQTVFCIGSYHSNAWKSDNPHSGVYEAEVSKTLDALNCGYPACNQGGMAVVGVAGFASQSFAEIKESDVGAALRAAGGAYGGGSENYAMQKQTVRRLTPLECERLQGFPSEKKVDVSKMTKDEYIAWNLAEKNIIADPEKGIVYATRGPGGIFYDEPKELKGTELNGYRVVSIRNGGTKLQCRVHRIIWISQNGIIPEGYCIDHINNDKQDNRISNLQLLTPQENSHKAKEDGLYLEGLDNKVTKLDPDLKDELCYLYHISDLTQRELAEIYGISKSRVNQIIKEIGWTDIGEWIDSKGKKHDSSDSARYKALGNSIALPFWRFLCKRISAQYARKATMASLFDGIGGFPLVWEEWNGKGSAVWASEIEEFPMAVTKYHFREE